MPTTAATLLMFEGRAEEAMTLYVALFPDSHVEQVTRYEPGEGGRRALIKRADLTIAGHRVVLIDSPIQHAFTFTPSVSLYVDCNSGAEFDQIIKVLSESGQFLMPPDNYGFSSKFAWLTDRFGVSWQLSLP